MNSDGVTGIDCSAQSNSSRDRCRSSSRSPLVRHDVREYQEPSLSREVSLSPHLQELMLRNHA